MRKLLTKRVRAAISKTASEMKDGDLYNSLKRVGDDSCKAEIEQALKELLDESTFRSVVACFKIATSDELP